MYILEPVCDGPRASVYLVTLYKAFFSKQTQKKTKKTRESGCLNDIIYFLSFPSRIETEKWYVKVHVCR